MKQKVRFFTHTSSLWVLFILGNAIITRPTKNANKYTFLGFMVSAVLGVALYYICLPIAKKLFANREKAEENSIFKVLFCIVYLAVAVFAVFCAADTFSDFTEFVKDILLKDTPMFFINLIFLAVIVFFAFRRQEDTLKFFLIAFWFSVAIIIFFFIATAFKFNFKNIFIFELPKFSQLYLSAKPYILNPVLPTILLPVYNVAVFGEERNKHAIVGCALGYLILGICVISTVLLFGSALAGRLSYPYSSAVSTVSIGRLFTRLDGFSYFIYFATSLAKITVCVFVAKTCVRKLSCH